MRTTRVLLLAGVLALTGSSAIARPSAPPDPTGTITDWSVGVRAGTTTFSSAPGATCRPTLDARASDRRCAMRFSGRFTAPELGYRGTYSGTARIGYLDPSTSDYAAFEAGEVTYRIRDARGRFLSSRTLAIDLGTGGVYGYPDDLAIAYWIGERSFDAEDLVLTVEGNGLNRLDRSLQPVRTFIDRLAYG